MCSSPPRAGRRRAAEGVDHRVVVIDARGGFQVNGHTIAPHNPWIDVFNEPASPRVTAATLMLNRQHFRISGTGNGPPEVQNPGRFRCVIPSLLEFDKDLVPDPAVIVNGVHAVAFFDLSGGTIRAEFRHNCAGVAIYEAEVSNSLTLQRRGMNEDLVDMFELSDDAVIHVNNVGDGADDNNADFLLNYLVSGRVPDNAGFPDKCRPCGLTDPLSDFPPHSIGPGCSNTQYP